MNTSTDDASVVPVSNGLSSEEQAKIAGYLTSTGEKLLALTGDLSDEQWRFKAAAGQWSIGEVIEHIVMVEKRVQQNVVKIADGEPAEPGRDHTLLDELILNKMFTRDTKVQAPPILQPSGDWQRTEGLEKFLETRSETLALLNSAPVLRARVISHPLLGALDGYQWVLAAAGHCARHLEQIGEIKSAPNFPPS